MRTWLISLLARTVRLWFRASLSPNFDEPRSILIVKPCCLGDVLLTTPLVAAVHAGYPHVQITYATGAWSRPMVTTSEHVDSTLTLPERWTIGSFLATARMLRTRQFDLVFVPDRSPVLTLLVWLADIPQRIGLDSAGRGFAYTHPVPVSPFVTHEADEYSSLAIAAKLSPPRRLFFFPSKEAVQVANQLLGGETARRLIALHPGGGQNPGMTLPRKRWLPERWAAIADEMIERYNATVVLVGGTSDLDVVNRVKASMRGRAQVLVNQWDWGVLGAFLQRCDLFLGHDTGMMHLAMAVGTPTVAVFGPSDPQMYGPYGDHGCFVWKPTVQSPCFYAGEVVPECSCNMQCMRNVEVDDVLSAIKVVWNVSDSRGR